MCPKSATGGIPDGELKPQVVSGPREQQLLSTGVDGGRQHERRKSTSRRLRPSPLEEKNVPENTILCDSKYLFPTGSNGSDKIPLQPPQCCGE